MILRFIKRQLKRSGTVIKDHWDFFVVEPIDDFGLTKFGKYFIRGLMFIIFILYITIVIAFIPLILLIFKDAKEKSI